MTLLELSSHAQACDLTPSEVAALESSCHRVTTIQTFATEWAERAIPVSPSLAHELDIAGRYQGLALGIQSYYDTQINPYMSACEEFNLLHCQLFINELKFPHSLISAIDPEFVEHEMGVVAALGLPAVFFVPPDLKSHERANLTKLEMQWLLDNRELAANFWIVFGLYQLLEQVPHIGFSLYYYHDFVQLLKPTQSEA